MFFSSLTPNQMGLPFDSAGANWELAFIWFAAFVQKKKEDSVQLFNQMQRIGSCI